MAKTYAATDIRLITNFEFEQKTQTLIYEVSLNDENDESKKVKSNDIDGHFLNSAEWNKLMKNIAGLPKHLASHKKLLEIMTLAFSDDDENMYFFVHHWIDDVAETKLRYTKFIMKQEYITGIPLEVMIANLFTVYGGDSIVIDPSLIPSPDEVKTYIFIN